MKKVWFFIWFLMAVGGSTTQALNTKRKMIFASFILSLAIVCPSFARAGDGPERMEFLVYENSPSGTYVAVPNGTSAKGDGIFHIPKDLEPYHTEGR